MSTLNTGDVARRIGIPVTEKMLTELGFKPTGKDKRAFLWDEDDYPEMCQKIGQSIMDKASVTTTPAKPPAPPRKPKAGATPAPAPVQEDDDDL